MAFQKRGSRRKGVLLVGMVEACEWGTLWLRFLCGVGYVDLGSELPN